MQPVATSAPADSHLAGIRRRLAALVVALLSVLVLPRLLARGMFLDGVHFAAVARNLAEGVGSFWAPHYTATVFPVENEHPPLGFWLQSLAFRLGGDGLHVEALYGYLLALANVALLALLWRTATTDRDRSGALSDGRAGAWLPALLYVALPMTAGTYRANLLEGTMTTFVLVAAILAHRGARSATAGRAALFGALAGLAVLAAVLTKGPAGLFVLVLPALAAAYDERVGRRSAAVVTVASLVTGVAAALLVLLEPAARAHTRVLYGERVLGSLRGAEGGSRWEVLGETATELAVPVVLLAVGWLVTRVPWTAGDWRRAALFLAVGLCGVLPFLATTAQERRYLFPAMPFLAIGLAFLANGIARRLEESAGPRARRAVAGSAALLLVAAVVAMAMSAGRIVKAEDFHRDLGRLATELGERPLVSVCPAELAGHWELVANMQRSHRASLTAEPGHELRLVEVGHGCPPPPPACRPLNPGALRYRLYRCPPAASVEIASPSQRSRSSAT